MTSREHLKDIADKTALYHSNYKPKFDLIDKDLEVLEILKNKKYIPLDRINPKFWNDKETYDETCNYEFYLWLCEEECEYVVKEEQKLTLEEFTKVKEWLEKGEHTPSK